MAMNKIIHKFFPIFIFLVAIVYRAYGLLNQYPFWVDEFSSAHQALLLAKYGFSAFTNPMMGIDLHNTLTHVLIALSFGLFGAHEWTARLPFVLIGSLVPVGVFFLTRYLFNLPVAISATLLTTTSYMMITWSRQARGYALQQLLAIIAIYLYLRLLKKSSSGVVFAFFAVAVLGVLTHFMFFILLGSFFIHYFLFRRKDFIVNILKNKLSYILLVLFGVILYKFGFVNVIKVVIIENLFKTNNLWYYHSFLWREYGLITFLGVVGLLLAYRKYKEPVSLFLLYIGTHLLFLTFLWPPYTSRYLLPIFPLLFIGVGFSLSVLAANFSKRFSLIITVVLALGIIVGGDKFVTKPKQFYSVNHDFREIALIDYGQVYDIIKTKGNLKENQTAVIDTWHDRLYWYLGVDYPNAYIFRWINEPGLVNGLPKLTNYELNSEGEKIIPHTKNLRFIGELKDLQLAMKKYSKGFIFIDDASLPKDVIEYAEKNFKKELYLDHYPLDDNPYSIWPATLYSWGIE